VLLEAPSRSPTLPASRLPEDSDVELIQRAQLGNVEAFASIYDRHASVALALGARILASASDAQDLLQDVFFEAWQNVREYDPTRASVRAWLLVRMRSRALDRLGRRTRETLLHRAFIALRNGTDVVHPQDERCLALRTALNQLDEHVRDALELTYFWGLTAPEIGTHLKVPEGTVRSRIERGLRELERRLGAKVKLEGGT
jgi:RNA polymerase sigma-70 factor, ECF subfamily